jgi:hypothetical protein
LRGSSSICHNLTHRATRGAFTPLLATPCDTDAARSTRPSVRDGLLQKRPLRRDNVPPKVLPELVLSSPLALATRSFSQATRLANMLSSSARRRDMLCRTPGPANFHPGGLLSRAPQNATLRGHQGRGCRGTVAKLAMRPETSPPPGCWPGRISGLFVRGIRL